MNYLRSPFSLFKKSSEFQASPLLQSRNFKKLKQRNWLAIFNCSDMGESGRKCSEPLKKKLQNSLRKHEEPKTISEEVSLIVIWKERRKDSNWCSSDESRHASQVLSTRNWKFMKRVKKCTAVATTLLPVKKSPLPLCKGSFRLLEHLREVNCLSV